MNIFPSTSWVTVVLPVPIRMATTGASAPIDRALATSASIALSDYRLLIYAADNGGIVTTICNALCNALPSGIFVSIDGLQRNFIVSLTAASHSVGGNYYAQLSYVPDADYAWSEASFQWGGWVDALIGKVDSIDASTTGTVQILSNRIDVDDPNAPTTITVYQSDDVTPLRTRTIANADGSPVNPAQILRLGRYI